MVLIPSGVFEMGAVPGDADAKDDEKPRHTVQLSRSYYMDVHEVTLAMWKKYAQSAGVAVRWKPPEVFTSDTPVSGLSWTEVQGYLRWVSASLPTEAQWERAARGGVDGFVFPWGNSDDVRKRNGHRHVVDGEVVDDDGFEFVAPVTAFPPNAFGLYGMASNGEEWCGDYYLAEYYARSPGVDPKGPETRQRERVIRSAGVNAGSLRVSARSSAHPDWDVAGFRCVRELPPEQR